MVATLNLHAEGKVQRVGILDFDQHFGDGTENIIATKQLGWIRHVSKERSDPEDTEPFLDQLPQVMRSFSDCDLLM